VALTEPSTAVRSPSPKWPPITDALLEQATLIYDVTVDTMMVNLFGRPLPAFSMPLDAGDIDVFYLRLDAETDAVVGLQIEGFVSLLVPAHPEYGALLDRANLLSLSTYDVARLRRRVLGAHRTASRRPAAEETLRSLVRAVADNSPPEVAQRPLDPLVMELSNAVLRRNQSET
jgi:hypothetical protein